MTNLVPKGQEVVVYPHKVYGGNVILWGLHMSQPSLRLWTPSKFEHYLDRQSKKVHRTGDFKCKKKDTYSCVPALTNPARPASSILAGEREVRGKEQRKGSINIETATVRDTRK